MQHGAPLETFSRLACQSEMALALPGDVRRPRSPPDRVVGGPGRGHAVCAACEAANRGTVVRTTRVGMLFAFPTNKIQDSVRRG